METENCYEEKRLPGRNLPFCNDSRTLRNVTDFHSRYYFQNVSKVQQSDSNIVLQ